MVQPTQPPVGGHGLPTLRPIVRLLLWNFDRTSLAYEDINALSDHYSQQAFVAAKQPFDESKAAAGAALHEKYCETCHSEGGTAASRGPRLAGQWVPYLKSALHFVPTGEHLVPPMMERAVSDLSSEEIDMLMDYYASQQD